MSYRDDTDALRARLEQREAELAAAHAKIAKLEGGRPKGKTNPFLGAPSQIVLDEVFDVELSEEALEKVVWVLRDRYDNLGRLERLGNTVAWTSGAPQRPLDVFLDRQDGKTRVRIRERLANTAGGLFGGLVGGLGGGGTAGAIGIAAALGVAPIGFPLVAVGWIGSVYLGVRVLYKKIVGSREKEAAGVMASIEELLHTLPNVRVDVSDPVFEEVAEARTPQEAVRESE